MFQKTPWKSGLESVFKFILLENLSRKLFLVLIKMLISFLIIFGTTSLLNSYKLFQYKLNNEKNYRKSFPYEKRDETYCEETRFNFECKLFNSFKLINSLLNDMLFVFLNLLIDIVLVRNFHFHLERKSRQTTNTTQNSSNLAQKRAIQKGKTRVNRMIFYSSLAYITSHMPECIVTILLVVYSKKISKFCENNVSCEIMSEEAEFFCLISIVCQSYIFIFFDKNFKASFKEIRARWTTPCWNRSEAKSDNDKNKVLNRINYANTSELKNLKNLIGNGLID